MSSGGRMAAQGQQIARILGDVDCPVKMAPADSPRQSRLGSRAHTSSRAALHRPGPWRSRPASCPGSCMPATVLRCQARPCAAERRSPACLGELRGRLCRERSFKRDAGKLTSQTRDSHHDPVLLLDLGPEGLGLGGIQVRDPAHYPALLVHPDEDLRSSSCQLPCLIEIWKGCRAARWAAHLVQ